MPFNFLKTEKGRYALKGAALGTCAPILHTLLHYSLFHRGLDFQDFLGEEISSPASLTTHLFIASTIIVMGVAGYALGKARERSESYRTEIEDKNIELEKSQAELKDITENLEKKVKEGRDELLDSSAKLKEANAKLLRQIEIQRKIAGNVPSLLALVDTNMNYVEMNEYGSHHFLGRPLSEILGHKCYQVMDSKAGVCIEECATRRAFDTGREASHTRIVFVRGKNVITENKSIPLKDADGHVTHVLMIVTDTTAKKKEEDDLKRRANHDALTGVYNKHFLDLYLQNEERKNRADKRKRGPYTIIFSDLDNLKEANDSHGHEAGDVLLKKMAQVFLDNTRHEDVIARVGGDEFVIILPHSGPEEGEVLINRFKRQCDEWNRSGDGLKGINLTVSYGLSTSVYGTDLFDTIRRADATMYRAKKDKKAPERISEP